MPRYGYNLDDWFEKLKFKICKNTILDIGIRLSYFLQNIHEAGYVYNDLKLDNIMIGYGKKPIKSNEGKSLLEGFSLHLVDFGFATKYISKGVHIECSDVPTFRGNMMFSSLNQLNFKTPSRRDDMIALCYLLSFLLNEGVIKGIQD